MNLSRNLFVAWLAGLICAPLFAASPTFDLSADHMGKVNFLGSQSAELFSKEIDASFKGALALDYVSKSDGTYPAGFIHASPDGQPWHGTMWTRDAGTFMRELAFWGDYQHACQLAQCVMDFVGTDSNGFIAFSRYFKPENDRQPGSEMDGQAATIISMVALWQRLPGEDPFRARLYEFLHQKSSPVRGIHFFLQHDPLVPGSGEFGGGSQLRFNVVQNNLCALALISAADMEEKSGDHAAARLYRKDAKTIFHNIDKYLVNKDGSFVWNLDTKTLKPDSPNEITRSGNGGNNGVSCMSADVLGLDPANWPWQGAFSHGEKTFEDLYAFPPRKAQFDKYGIWPQMNYAHKGLLTSPSYGQGYALQDMLLFDKPDMADRGLNFLAQFTYRSPGVIFSYDHNRYHYGRLSPYYFYERMYSPDAKGKMEMTAGCGPLNLVNVSEPLKVARLIVGVDDTSDKQVQIIPRLPSSWSGYHAENWPIRTDHGIVRADISLEKTNGSVHFALQIKEGGPIPKLSLRLPGKNTMIWLHRNNVTEFSFKSAAPN